MNKFFFQIILNCFSLSLFLQGAHATEVGRCPTPQEVMKNISNITSEGREFKSLEENALQGKLVEAYIKLNYNKNNAFLDCRYSIKSNGATIPRDIITYRSEFKCDGENAISFRSHTSVTTCNKQDLGKSCPVWCAVNDLR